MSGSLPAPHEGTFMTAESAPANTKGGPCGLALDTANKVIP